MKKKLMIVLMMICVLITSLGVMPVMAETVYDYLKYEIADGEVAIKGLADKTVLDVVIPNEIEGYPVTSIASSAFANCTKVMNISIPDTVKTIGHHAFYSCELITSLTIPSSVEIIDGAPFVNCKSLNNIYVDPDNQYFMSDDGVLYDKEQTTLRLFPTARPETEFSIPDCVTKIGYSAFNGCLSLTEITIPEGVTDISEDAFNLCKGLKNITIPEGVVSIGKHSFSSCTSLTEVTFPKSLTSICEWSFSNCTSLTTLTIPKTLTEVGNSAFYLCDKISAVNYYGTAESWSNIKFGTNNTKVRNANIVYLTETSSYTYVFYDGDGETVLKADMVEEGSEIIPPETPVKEADGQYTYTFSHWEGYTEGMVITEDVEFNAVYIVTPVEVPYEKKQITVSSEMTVYDEEVTITVSANEGIGMAIGSILINYDRDKMTLTDYSFGELLSDTQNIINTEYNDNGVEKVYFSFLGLDEITAEGNLLTLKFVVNADVINDTHIPVTIDRISLYDYNENEINVDTVNGEVHLLDYMLGDVNEDGIINLIDVLRVMKYDVGLINLTTVQEYAADVNGDGNVSMSDAILIQKYDAGLIQEF